MSDQRAVEVTVSGQVQGVGFRAHAAQRAVQVEVVGWVRNEPDGSVALHVEGDPGAVGEMLDWLRAGPPLGSVDSVEVRDVEPRGSSSFEVRY